MKQHSLQKFAIIALAFSSAWLLNGCGGKSQPKEESTSKADTAKQAAETAFAPQSAENCCDTSCYQPINCLSATCQDFVVARHMISEVAFDSLISTNLTRPTNYFVADIKKMLSVLDCQLGDYISYTLVNDSIIELKPVQTASAVAKAGVTGPPVSGKFSVALFNGFFRQYKAQTNDVVAVYILQNVRRTTSAGFKLIRQRKVIACCDFSNEYP